jgi:hypothetical protein
MQMSAVERLLLSSVANSRGTATQSAHEPTADRAKSTAEAHRDRGKASNLRGRHAIHTNEESREPGAGGVDQERPTDRAHHQPAQSRPAREHPQGFPQRRPWSVRRGLGEFRVSRGGDHDHGEDETWNASDQEGGAPPPKRAHVSAQEESEKTTDRGADQQQRQG